MVLRSVLGSLNSSWKSINWKSISTYLWILYWLILFCMLFANTLHEEYTDEFDNILGGWYILHGKLPFSGFFSHHGPIAYLLAAPIALLSGNSFVKFRIIYSLVLFVAGLISYLYLKRKFGFSKTWFYLVFLYVIGIAATYFWGHMFIADNLSAYFFIPVFATLILRKFYNEKITHGDLWVISAFSALSLLTSLTFLYLVGFLYLFVLYFYFLDNRINLKSIKAVEPILIFSSPFLLFVIYLILTFSVGDYIYQSIIYNSKYYVYNYPAVNGVTNINPLRHTIIIASNFITNFYDVLLQVKSFNFNFPFNITLALANLTFIIYLLFKRKFTLALLIFLIITFANSRNNPLLSGEKDYQSAVYIVFSLFVLSFILIELYKLIDNHDQKNLAQKIIFSFLFIILSSYAFFTGSFLINKFKEKTYNKFMGLAPLIYDRPEIAKIVNTAATKDEYVWVGPLEFKELLYTHSKLPSKYHIIIPGIRKSEKIKQEMLADLETSKPLVIWFDNRYTILGYSPSEYATFFSDYLKKEYVTLYDYKKSGYSYKQVAEVTTKIDIERNLYINKNSVDLVINRLLQANLIREVPAP